MEKKASHLITEIQMNLNAKYVIEVSQHK